MWAGSTVPPSAKPSRHGEVTAGPCHLLPSRAVAGGWSIAGRRAWSCLSRAHRAQGRKEGPFRTETTYHPPSPVTNQGRRGGKSPALGFLLLMSRDVPAARAGQSPEPWCGAVGRGRDAPTATGCCTKETLLLCEVPLENRLTPKVTLGRWEPSLVSGREGGKGFPAVGRRKGSLGQVFHWQLLLQVPVVRNRHILVGGGHQRDGSAVVLGLGWFLLHVHWVAVGGKPSASGSRSPQPQPPTVLAPNPPIPWVPLTRDRSHRRQRAAPGARSATVPYLQTPRSPATPLSAAGLTCTAAGTGAGCCCRCC